jgi:hypothetical protein
MSNAPNRYEKFVVPDGVKKYVFSSNNLPPTPFSPTDNPFAPPPPPVFSPPFPNSYRIAFEIDTKVANAGTFVLQREDHTIGNLLRM